MRRAVLVLTMKLSEALESVRKRLKVAGVPSADFDARALAAHVLGVPLSQLALHRSRLLTGDELARLDTLVAHRLRREPLQYLLGETEFYGRRFLCDPRALIPRPDTETVVEVALELIRELHVTHVADIGTGSGVIGITLAAEEPGLEVLATDTSPDALALAAENVALQGLGQRVRLAQGPWLEPLEQSGWRDDVGMIVSNPPYVRSDQFETLMPEIREYEPREALVGPDADGLGAYREIIQQCSALPALRAVVLEVGQGQAGEVGGLLKAALPLSTIIVRRDLGRVDRVVAAAARLASI